MCHEFLHIGGYGDLRKASFTFSFFFFFQFEGVLEATGLIAPSTPNTNRIRKGLNSKNQKRITVPGNEMETVVPNHETRKDYDV